MSKQPCVWVVEMREGHKWLPCASATLTREDAKKDIAEWRTVNPGDPFRVAKYVRVEPKKKRSKP